MPSFGTCDQHHSSAQTIFILDVSTDIFEFLYIHVCNNYNNNTNYNNDNRNGSSSNNNNNNNNNSNSNSNNNNNTRVQSHSIAVEGDMEWHTNACYVYHRLYTNVQELLNC